MRQGLCKLKTGIDKTYAGSGLLAGSIKASGSPYGPVYLRIYDEHTGIIVKQGPTAADGTFSFYGFSKSRTFTIDVYDETGTYGLGAAGGITPA